MPNGVPAATMSSSSSSEPATAAAQRPAIELSVDDYAQHVLLPRFLRLFEDALNRPLQARLLECFGEESWLKEAKNCVGRDIKCFVTEAAPWDIPAARPDGERKPHIEALAFRT